MLRVLFFFLFILSNSLVWADDVTIGVLAYKSKQSTINEWTPLAEELNNQISEHHFLIKALDFNEFNIPQNTEQLNFIIVNPQLYIKLKHNNNFTSPIATLNNIWQDQSFSYFGGVIFAKADSTISAISDIKNKRVAITGKDSFGGYSTQAYELVKDGQDLSDVIWVNTGMPHDNVIDYVKSGKADIGFVRTGVIEDAVLNNKINLSDIKIIHKINNQNFPTLLSTELYPEWVVASKPDNSIDYRKIASVLLNFKKKSKNGILVPAFDLPQDYDSVERVMQELKLEPFNINQPISIADIWQQYKLPISIITGFFLIMLGLILKILKSNSETRAEELKFKTVADYTYDWEYWLTPENKFMYISPSCLITTGYTQDEFLNNPTLLELIVAEDDKHTIKEHLLNNHVHKQEENINFKIFHKNGQTIHINHICKPIFTKSGQYIGKRVVNRDVTETVLQAEKLKKNETWLKAIINNEPECIKIVDKNCNLVDMNSAGLAMLKVNNLEQIKGKHVCELLPPEFKDEFLKFHNKVINGENLTMEFQILQADGNTMWVETHAVPLVNDNGETVHLAVTRDISDKKRYTDMAKKMQKFLEDILENSPIAVRVATNNGNRVVFANKAYCELINSPKDWVVGKNPKTYYANPQDYTEIVETVSKNQIIYNKKVELLLPEKGKRISMASYMPFEYMNQPAVLGWFFDITDIENAKIAAERMSKLRSEFLANMSHEIRTPLNGIIGLSDLALISTSENETKDYLSKILSSSKTLLGIINDILDFSKLEADKAILHNSNYTIQQLINNLGGIFDIAANAKNINFNIISHLNHNTVLNGDIQRLQQVLFNLVGNAIKFTDRGGVGLDISKNETQLIFCISDTGIGIADSDIDKLFKPFSQADGSITRNFGGTGLGLSICKKLLDLMGGAIDVASIINKGTVITVKVPLSLGTNQTTQPQHNIVSQELFKNKMKGKKLLIAEDNKINQLVLSGFLKNSEIEYEIANNGLEVLDLLKRPQAKFDAILMDVQMPKMGGIETTSIIRKSSAEWYSNIPIIAVTAGVLEEEQESYSNVGMNDFVAKPIILGNLMEILINNLG